MIKAERKERKDIEAEREDSRGWLYDFMNCVAFSCMERFIFTTVTTFLAA